MVQDMSELLKELGWTDGFRIPVADKENRKLEVEVEEFLKEKANILINLEAHRESIVALQRQLSNYEEEEVANQKMLVTRQNQLETEYTRLRLSESEHSKLLQEISDVEKKLKEFEAKHVSLQAGIDRLMVKLNSLKNGTEWREEALLSWNEVLTKRVDETDLMERFCAEDLKNYEALIIQRKKLLADITERREILDSVMSDKTTAEFQMQQCGKLFRRAVNDYRTYMRYWNTSVDFIRERDNKIKDLFKEICSLKKDAIAKYDELRDRLKFRDSQKKNNSEMEQLVYDMDEKARIVKEALNKVSEENLSLVKQKNLTQSHLSVLGAKLTEQRSITSISSSKLELRNSDLIRALDAKQVFNSQYEKLCNENISQAERNDQLHMISKELEKCYNLVAKDAEKLKAMLSSQMIECKELHEKSELRMADVKHGRTSCVTLDKKIKEIESLIHHHQEILYSNRYSLVKLMRKLAKYEGEQDLDLKEKLVARIHELEAILKEKTDAFSLISGQVKHSEEDLRRMNLEVEKGCLELHHLMDGRQDRAMTVEGGQKKLQHLKEINQQLQVDQNILQLQINQIEKNVAKQDDSVYNLEKQRLELEAAMRERRIEIQAQRDILLAKKKTLLEEKSELKRTIEHLNSKISQVHRRFEIAMDMLGTTKDNMPEGSVSVTQCKIKIAQEKNELQEKGDKLDANIRRLEKEILAMENTLKLINSTNDSYKLNLCSVDEDSPEMEEKRQLEASYLASLQEMKKQRIRSKDINNAIKEMEDSLVASVEMEEKLQSEWKMKDKEARDLDKELGDQQIKLLRAEKQFKKVARHIRSIREPSIPIKFAEKDIETRELQDINNNALNQLAEISNQYIETAPVINRIEYKMRYTRFKSFSSSSKTSSVGRLSYHVTDDVFEEDEKLLSYLSEKGLTISSVRRSMLRSKSGSTMSLTPSMRSDITTGSATTSNLSVSEHSVPSIVNLDLFANQSAPVVKTSSGSLGKKKSAKLKSNSLS